MRVLKLCSFLVLISISTWALAQVSPHTVSMASGDSNFTAFSSNGQLGTNIATFYVHWDATYVYFGWDGGNTNWTNSDLYFVAIDTNNDGGASLGSEIYGVSYTDAVFDYYVVSENNCSYFGPYDACNGGGTQGNAFELYQAISGSWNWVSRRAGNDNTQSRRLDANPGETRVRVSWADLSFTPGPGNPIAFSFWVNNSSANYVWGSWPSDNPGPGSTPYTLTRKLFFPSTGSGVDPATAGTSVSLATALPIELISFDASAKGETVELDWSTAAEMNNSHFTIEHALDGKEFYAIGHVEGAGESTELLRYAYTHEQPAVGTNYYRLAQYDYDGTVSYSDIEMVRIGSGTTSIQVFPNPTKDQITIQIDEPIFTGSIQVYDVHGSLVAQQGSRSNTTFDMNTETWEAGIYQLVICPDRGDCITKTIIKQ